MGRFKESVHEVLGQLFRHSDIDQVLGDGNLEIPDAPRPKGRKARVVDESLTDSLLATEPVAPDALAKAARPEGTVGSTQARTGGRTRSRRAVAAVEGPDPGAPPAGPIARVGPASAVPAPSATGGSRSPIRLEQRVKLSNPQSQTKSKTRALRLKRTSQLAPVEAEKRPLPLPAEVGDPPEVLGRVARMKEELFRRLKLEQAAAGDQPAEQAALAALLRHADSGRIELPSLPLSAKRLRGHKGEVDDDVLVSVIRSDPAIAGRIMRLANAPLFAGVMPITSLPQALARVGLQQCRTVAIAAAYETALLPGVSSPPLLALQRHGAATATAAEALAPAAEVDPDQASLAGLLHDVGQILARKALVPAVAGLPERTVARLSLRYHLILGAMLADHWDLPQGVTAALGWHHHPELAPAPGRVMAWLLHVADAIAERALEHGRGPTWAAFLASRGPGTDPVPDGVENLDVMDLVAAWPGHADAPLFHGAIRTTLLRTAGSDLAP